MGSPIEYPTPLHAPGVQLPLSTLSQLQSQYSLERFVKGSDVCACAYGSCYVITMMFLFWYSSILLVRYSTFSSIPQIKAPVMDTQIINGALILILFNILITIYYWITNLYRLYTCPAEYDQLYPAGKVSA